MLDVLGESAIDQTLFDSQDQTFQHIHPTTWDELSTNGWTQRLDEVGMYRLTGTGWLGALQLTGRLFEQDFETKIGNALAAMKSHVKGRTQSALVAPKELAQKAGLTEGFVFNIVESKLVEEHHERVGPSWHDPGRLILIPRDFNIERIELNSLIREEASRRIEELEAQLQAAHDELGRYQCPHCKSALLSTGPVELSEDYQGCYEEFECGYAAIDGFQEHPCPKDPKFPRLDDFELKTEKRGNEWVSHAIGKTPYARQLRIFSEAGKTEEEAKRRVIARYNLKAGLISNDRFMDEFFGS